MRALHSISLGLLALSLPGCFDHHTADEQVLELVEVDDAGVGTTNKADASASKADASTTGCATSDPLSSFLCQLGGGNTTGKADAAAADPFTAIIQQILGGGGTGAATQNCSKQPDQIQQLLCTVTGGTGLEGLIGSLLGGGAAPKADAGIQGVIDGAINDVISGIIDDLIKSILTPQAPAPRADAGTGGLFGGLFGGGTGFQLPTRDGGVRRTAASIGSTSQALTESDLVRSEEECSSVVAEDVLTRLICARQQLDQLSAGPGGF